MGDSSTSMNLLFPRPISDFEAISWLALPDGREEIDPAFEAIDDLPVVEDGGDASGLAFAGGLRVEAPLMHGGLEGEFETLHLFDADGRGSVEIIAPPPPAVRAGGAGGLVLPGETAAHASETLAYSGICVRHGITRLGKAPSKASSPLAHQFCVFLSSSSARCCPAVPEPLLEPSTWPGAVIIGVRALALAPYLEPRGVYFILVLSRRARRPRTTREVRASHPAPALACA